MKQVIISVLLLFLAQQTKAQTSERIQINAGNFVVPQKESLENLTDLFIRQIGISYTHRLYPKLALSASFTRWFQPDEIGGNPFGHNAYYEPVKQFKDRRLGDIEAHYDYRSVDLTVLYQLVLSKRHELYTGAGISYTWGWYYEYTGIYNEPGYPDWLFELTKRKHQDFGLIAEIGYNYLLFDHRVNIGVSETVKGYTKLPFQFYTNINIGYNFNWGLTKKKNR